MAEELLIPKLAKAVEMEFGHILAVEASGKEQTMTLTLTEFVTALAEQMESKGVTYEDLERIDEEVKAEVRKELEGADNE